LSKTDGAVAESKGRGCRTASTLPRFADSCAAAGTASSHRKARRRCRRAAPGRDSVAVVAVLHVDFLEEHLPVIPGRPLPDRAPERFLCDPPGGREAENLLGQYRCCGAKRSEARLGFDDNERPELRVAELLCESAGSRERQVLPDFLLPRFSVFCPAIELDEQRKDFATARDFAVPVGDESRAVDRLMEAQPPEKRRACRKLPVLYRAVHLIHRKLMNREVVGGEDLITGPPGTSVGNPRDF
jgi:hypothetical protein